MKDHTSLTGFYYSAHVIPHRDTCPLFTEIYIKPPAIKRTYSVYTLALGSGASPSTAMHHPKTLRWLHFYVGCLCFCFRCLQKLSHVVSQRMKSRDLHQNVLERILSRRKLIVFVSVCVCCDWLKPRRFGLQKSNTTHEIFTPTWLLIFSSVADATVCFPPKRL